MLASAVLLLSFVAFVSLLFGVRYALAREFMPHHSAVAGVPWSELDARMQARSSRRST